MDNEENLIQGIAFVKLRTIRVFWEDEELVSSPKGIKLFKEYLEDVIQETIALRKYYGLTFDETRISLIIEKVFEDMLHIEL